MKYIPALFRGDMVRSILARIKRETRRPDKTGKPPCAVGDRLWVRETWRACDEMGNSLRIIPREGDRGYTVEWLADWPSDHPGPWRPSIHMPRAVSRIELEVTDVRLEHVQDITAQGSLAEGVPMVPRCNCDACGMQSGFCTADESEQIMAFAVLWDSIYGKTEFAWTNNPRVWVTTFKMVEAEG